MQNNASLIIDEKVPVIPVPFPKPQKETLIWSHSQNNREISTVLLIHNNVFVSFGSKVEGDV